MSILAKVIRNVNFAYELAEMREAIAPMESRNTIIESNTLMQVHRGDYFEGSGFQKIPEGSFYFIPKGISLNFRMGKSNQYESFGWEGHGGDYRREKYSRRLNPLIPYTNKKQVHSLLSFNALLHETIPFFSILELPAVIIPYEEELSYLLYQLTQEETEERLGKDTLLHSMTQQVVIRICRYLESRPEYATHMDRIKYLTDSRLIDIISYIKNNLDKDLSNKKLAEISFYAEDYIGQFFKSLTSQNLQEYVEKQRLEKAKQLLISTQETAQSIAYRTGFRDPAYFSRRFRKYFKKSANEIRRSIPRVATVH
jgi:AraC-like DNA-binding protein